MLSQLKREKSSIRQTVQLVTMIDKKLIGPALEGVNDKYSEEWLIKWIKNSAEMIASGDPQAVAIYEEYNKSPMTSFLHFSDEDVVNILAYIEAGSIYGRSCCYLFRSAVLSLP